MKKFLLLLLPSLLLAASNTPNMGLEKPDFQSTRWDLPVLRNYDIIDSSTVVYPVNLNSGVTGTLPAANTVSSTVYTSIQNNFTDQNNFQAITASSISVNGPINTNLTANQCVQVGAAGLLTTSGAGCSTSGGASSLATNQNGVQITSPTRAMNGLSPPFLITAVGGGTTAQWTLDGSSVTLRGTNVVNLQSSLQLGATFFVSSGTVLGQITTNKIVVSTLSVSGETTLGNLRVTGGNGLTIDNLTSGRCVQTDTGGLLTVASGVCNGAGSGDAILAATQTFSGTDTFLHQINVAGTIPILSTSSLQSGTTIYVSSGTVVGPLAANSIAITGATGAMQGVNGGIGISNTSGSDFVFGLTGGGYAKTGSQTSFAQIAGDGNSFLVIKSSNSNASGGANIYTWARQDGSANQCLATDGSKNLSFITPLVNSTNTWTAKQSFQAFNVTATSATVTGTGGLRVMSDLIVSGPISNDLILSNIAGTGNSSLSGDSTGTNSNLTISASNGVGINFSPKIGVDLYTGYAEFVTSATIQGSEGLGIPNGGITALTASFPSFNVTSTSATVTGANLTVLGFTVHGSSTTAGLAKTTPSSVNQMWYCSNCTSALTCISTGTVIGAYSSMQATNRTTGCL